MKYIHLLNGDCWTIDQEKSTADLLRELAISLQIAPDRLSLHHTEQNEHDHHYHLVVNDSPDYPFTDYSTYFRALALSLMNPDAIRVPFPRYQHILDHTGNADGQILLDLLDLTHDPQAGFTGLTHALLRGNRYACDLIPFLVEAIDEMIRRGAQWTDEIWQQIAHGQFTDPRHFEDDMGNILRVKASLLDLALRSEENRATWKELIPEWETIVPVQWEDMMEWPSSRLDRSFLPYDKAYRKALKFESMSFAPRVQAREQ